MVLILEAPAASQSDPTALSGLISGKGHLAIETTQTDEVGRPSVRGKVETGKHGRKWTDGRPDKEVMYG